MDSLFRQLFLFRFAAVFYFFLLAFGGLFYGLAFDGYDFFGDDLGYLQAAKNFTQGKFIFLEAISAQRIGFILPISGLFCLLGFNDLSASLLPFLAYTSILLLIYRYFSIQNSFIAIYAGILFGLDYYTLLFSHKPYPDLPLAATIWGFVLLLYYRSNHWLIGASLASLFFFGFLIKETIIYLLPSLVFWFIYDFRQRQQQRFWFFFSLFLGLFGGFYLYLNFYFTNDFFYRFNVIQSGHYIDSNSYFDKPWTVLVARLTYEPILMFINSGLIISLLPSLPSFFRLRKKEFWQAKNWEFYLVISALSILGMFWFFSTSWRFYNPIGLLGRMILMMVPIVAVLSAMNLVRAFQKPIYFGFLSGGFALCAGLVYYFYASKLVLIYGLLSLLMGVYGYIIEQELFHKPFIINQLNYFGIENKLDLPLKSLAICLLLILLIHPIYALLKPSETNYQAEKTIFKQHFKQTSEKVIVFADVVTLHTLSFSLPYQSPPNYRFLAYEELRKAWGKELVQYVMINPAKLKFSSDYQYPVPNEVINPPITWKLIIQVGEVKVYQILNEKGNKL